MKNDVYSKILKIFNFVFTITIILWVYNSLVYFAYIGGSLKTKLFILVTILVIVLCYIFISPFKKILSNFYFFLMRHKIWLLIVLIMFQVSLILTAGALASSDSAVIFQLATHTKNSAVYASLSSPNAFSPQPLQNYLSLFPNNFFLFLIYKLFYIFTGAKYLVISLQVFNVILLQLSIVVLYKTIKTIASQNQADLTFVMFLIFYGLQPQTLETYSDTIILFLVSLFIFTITKIYTKENSYFKEKNNKTKISLVLEAIFIGFISWLIYIVKPSGIVVLLGLITVGILFLLQKKKVINILIYSSISLIAFIFLTLGFTSFKNNQEIVTYNPSLNTPASYYIALGLTDTGNSILYGQSNADLLPKKIRDAKNGELRSHNSWIEIKRRLSHYTPSSFLGFINRKFSFSISEGMLGWKAESVLPTNATLNLPPKEIQPLLEGGRSAQKVQEIVYTNGKHYYIYAFVIQIIYIVLIFGLLLYTINFSFRSYFYIWMQVALFGALLYLMIFEAGRSRYLIQFLPMVFILSSRGYALSYYRKHKREN